MGPEPPPPAAEAPASAAEPPGLKPRQAAWLAGLSPGRREVFDRLGAGKRAQLLEGIELGADAVVERELDRAAPRADPGPPPATTAELLARIREDPAFPAQAADRLAREFGDQKSFDGFRKACERAFLGARDPEDLVEAYRQATGPTARKRGAIFMTALKRLDAQAARDRGPA